VNARQHGEPGIGNKHCGRECLYLGGGLAELVLENNGSWQENVFSFFWLCSLCQRLCFGSSDCFFGCESLSLCDFEHRVALCECCLYFKLDGVGQGMDGSVACECSLTGVRLWVVMACQLRRFAVPVQTMRVFVLKGC
jgi:hypothetical protein